MISRLISYGYLRNTVLKCTVVKRNPNLKAIACSQILNNLKYTTRVNMEDAELRELLETHSTNRYSIEYRKSLSNHISHGIIALNKLGASKERIQQFITWYETKLEKPEDNPDELSLPESLTPDTLNEGSLLGKRCSFFPILDYYKKSLQEECQGSMEAFISRHLPRMVDGIGCTALHSLIQLGYGYSARSPLLVAEGMAYIHHSYLRFPLPENSTFGQGTTDILKILEEICQDEKLRPVDLSNPEETKWVPADWNIDSNFQKKVAIVFNSRNERIISYADRIQLPSWFKLSEASYTDVLALCDWVIDQAIAVYTGSERRNDFFLLHGVTGAWSLKQVLSAMTETPVKTLVSCIQEFVYVLLAVYIVEGRPKMVASYLSDEVVESWDQIFKDALNTQIDEHVYKMVQVSHERAMAYPPAQQNMFKRGALASFQFDFILRPLGY